MVFLHVLLVEDDEDDATLVLQELRDAGYALRVAERVATADTLRAALAHQAWDLVTCDYNLPGFSALAALTLIREHDSNLPIIVVSGEVGEELTVSLIRAGADDLVLKHNLRRLPGAVEHARRDAENRRRRAAAEAALQEESRISAALVRIGQECVASLDTATLLHRVCRATTEVLGCDYTHTALWDPEERAFVVTAGDDIPEHWERARALKFPLALIAEHAAQLRRDGIIHAGPAELAGNSTASAMAVATGATASLLVPLWRGEELIGVHTAGYRRPAEDFAPWQRRVAAGIGHLTSLALDNAHLLDRVTRSDRIKSEFLSTMSHELRTPLNHIIGFNDILLEEVEQLTAEQADMLQTIGRSSLDLLALVNGILDVQRLEAAPATAPAATDVAELLRQLTTTASVTCPSDLHVSCQLPPELPIVHTDPSKLKAVLQNLIDNAVKFTPRGSVTISAEAQLDGVLFTVADTGVGIPQDVLPIIFEPFRQGDASLTRQHGGVGLGLYIVRREVDRLGGQVTVDSEVGRGSTFRLWIPCEQRPTTKRAVDPQSDAPILYADILDATNDLVHTAAPDGRLLYANRAWQAALGYGSDELRALSLEDIVHPQSRAEFHQARQRALGGDPIHGLHVKCIAKDGRIVELEGGIRCRFANGAPTFTLCIYQNVTERTEAQRQAEARRQLLETLLTALPVGVWITDATGRITQANPAARRIWGGTRYVGIEEYGHYKGWFVASGQPIAAQEWAAARAVRRGETTVDEELEIESFDGTRKTILNSAIPLRDAAGDIASVIIVNHDITALKQTEEALRESEARYRDIFESAHDAIYTHDLLGNYTSVNPAMERLTGYSRAELLTMNAVQLAVSEHFQLSEQSTPGAYVMDVLTKDGPRITVEIRCRPVSQNGKVVGWEGVARDITERQRADLALRQSEERFALAVAGSNDGIWDWDLERNEIYLSPRWKQMLGLPEDEPASGADLWWPRVHPDDRERVVAAVIAHLDGTTPHYECEQRLLHADGTYRWILARGLCLRDAAAKPYRMAGSHTDITERRQAEEALREARASLEVAVEAARAGLWDWDLQTGETHYSESWRALFGYTPAEFESSMEAWSKIVHPDDLERLAGSPSAATAIVDPAAHYEEEFRLRHKDTMYRWVLSRARVLRDGAGTPQRMIGAHVDITGQKQTELALQEAQTSLQLATESAKVAVWKSDLRTLRIRFSSGWKRVLGRDEGELTLAALWDLVHPDDRAKTTAALQEHLQGRAPAYETEQRMLHADGSYRWVLSRGVVTCDAAGRPSHLFGADIDVTERKALAEALQRSEKHYRDLVEDITDIIYAADQDGCITYISPAVERLYGYAPAEVINRQFSEFFVPDDLPGVVDKFHEAMSGLPQPSEHRIVTKSGEIRWVRIHSRLILNNDGVVGLRGIISDVTQRRRTDEVLRAHMAEIETANRDLEAFSYSVSHDLRAPLRHINGFSKMLLEDYSEKLDDSGRRYLDRIRAGCQRMDQLILDLLALSRVSRQALRVERVDLSALARGIAADIQARESERVVDLVVADDFVALGDRSLLRVVLENLLGNAWKFTAKRPHARIELGGLHDQNRQTYFVRDDGAGFDPAFSDKLFAPFQRLHSEVEFEGTGIGLAIVARIIRRHGGKVWAEGAVEQGATFYFTLGDSSLVDTA